MSLRREHWRVAAVLLLVLVACAKKPVPGPTANEAAAGAELPREADTFLLEARTLDAEALMRAHGKEDYVTGTLDRDIGFGARSWHAEFQDETRYCTKGAVIFEGKTAIARVVCRSRPTAPLRRPTTKEYRNKETAARLRAVIERELGPAPDVAVPDDLRDDYDDLELPLSSQYAVGDACGDDGAKPEGRRATEHILAAKRADLLRALARAPSPEGRLYAATALRDPELLARVRALRTPLIACSGCIYGRRPAAEVQLSPYERLPGKIP